jgi:ribosome-binding factor A
MPSFRVNKMGSFIQSRVSNLIANKLNDPRISRFASVTRVEVSGDLQIAKVYISVLGSDADGRRTMAGLQHAAGHLQRLLAKDLSVRHVPQLRFLVDPSIKGTAETLRRIDEAVQQDGTADEPAPPDADVPDSSSNGVSR